MEVSPEKVHAAAGRMSSLADDFWDDIEKLRREAAALMEASWTGDASDTHAALWHEWVDSARRVVTALSEDAVLLHQTADQYHDTDTGHADSMAAYTEFHI